MAITNKQQEDLFKAYGLFIEAFRYYVVETLQKEHSDKWPAAFINALHPSQREGWNEGLKAGTNPEALIDYPHLKSFALAFRDNVRVDFKRDTNKLPTWLETLYDIRNKIAHFQEVDEDEFTQVFLHMKSISRTLGMVELEAELEGLQKGESAAEVVQQETPQVKTGKAMPWFNNVTPHADIRSGRLDESIFAANLAEVALGHGREIYNNPVVFFSKTYFTAGLKNVAKRVIQGLNGEEDVENRVISLQTGFGGGKTHTLISLYHIAKSGNKADFSEESAKLLEYTGHPNFEKANIAVFTNTTNNPATGRQVADDITLHTPWGELAWQLGGREAYELIRKNDEDMTAPGENIKKVLALTKPALILMDELADYCIKAFNIRTQKGSLVDQVISFVGDLTQAISETNHCVLVITLPASLTEVGHTPDAQAILTTLEHRVGRVGADTQPVANEEIFEVIRRRLFEDLGDAAVIESVVSKYMDMYQEYWTELPGNAVKTEYKNQILKSYPFHPELIDIFRIKWASHSGFQRTRGVLRLMASIVSDLWKRRQSLPGSNFLIHSGQINLSNLDSITSQLKQLYGNGYDAVISADVTGPQSNSGRLDNENPEFGKWYLAESLSTVILLNSFGKEGPNKGISLQELKLNLLTPKGLNHNTINGALDKLESIAHYMYYAQAGAATQRYWFYTKPNINILISQGKANVKAEEIRTEILERVNRNTTGGRINLFNIIVNPSEDIPEQPRLTLVILSPDYLVNGDLSAQTKTLIEKIATKKGNSDRINRNTLLFLVPNSTGYTQLSANLQEYIACQKIQRDYQGQLENEQKTEITSRMNEASKQAERNLAATYTLVAKYSAKEGISTLSIKQFDYTLTDQINRKIIEILKDEEWVLEGVGRNLLENNNLFPTLERPINVKELYEAFIRFDDKPMIKDHYAISDSIQRFCNNGELAVGIGTPESFSRIYYKEPIQFFDIFDENYWLVDKSLWRKKESPHTGPDPDTVPKTADALDPEPKPGLDIKSDTQEKTIKTVTISGKVPLENYSQLFTSFINPLKEYGVEIEVKIKGRSTYSKKISVSSQLLANIKESASQLGLDLEVEE